MGNEFVIFGVSCQRQLKIDQHGCETHPALTTQVVRDRGPQEACIDEDHPTPRPPEVLQG